MASAARPTAVASCAVHAATYPPREGGPPPASSHALGPGLPGRYRGTQPLGAPGRWNPCCTCPYSALPDALIASEIFGYLDRNDLQVASSVCSRWNFIAEQPIVWRQLSLASAASAGAAPLPASGVGLARLLARQGRAHAVEALAAPRLSLGAGPGAAVFAGLHLPRLRDLDLSGALAALATGGGAPGAAALRAFLLAHAGGLARLVLDGVTTLGDGDVAAVLRAATHRLRHLSLRNCAQLTDAALAPLHAAAAPLDGGGNADAAAPPRVALTSLRLAGCSGMTGAGVAAVVRGTCGAGAASCAHGARGSGGGGAPTRAPPAAAARLHRLRVCEVRGVPAVGDDLLAALASCAPLLSELDIGAGDPFGVGAAAAPPHLRHGAGAAAAALTGGGLRALAARCGGLTSLRLQGRAALDDDDLGAALALLPRLTVLDARGCRGVGAATIAAVVSAAGPQLLELRLFGCAAVTDAELRAVARSCRRLRLLDLYGCRRLTVDAVVAAVAALAPPRPGAANDDDGGAGGGPLASKPGATGGGGGALERVWVGGIPSVRAALPADTRGLTDGGGPAHGVREPFVQLSALFPAHVDVRFF